MRQTRSLASSLCPFFPFSGLGYRTLLMPRNSLAALCCCCVAEETCECSRYPYYANTTLTMSRRMLLRLLRVRRRMLLENIRVRCGPGREIGELKAMHVHAFTSILERWTSEVGGFYHEMQCFLALLAVEVLVSVSGFSAVFHLASACLQRIDGIGVVAVPTLSFPISTITIKHLHVASSTPTRLRSS